MSYEPFKEGQQAFHDDKGYAENPYQRCTALWHRWLEGYRQAEMEASEPPPPNNPPRST